MKTSPVCLAMKLRFCRSSERSLRSPLTYEDLLKLEEKLRKMDIDINALTAEMERNTTLVGSMNILVAKLYTELKAAMNSAPLPDGFRIAFENAFTKLRENDDALAAAMVANTDSTTPPDSGTPPTDGSTTSSIPPVTTPTGDQGAPSTTPVDNTGNPPSAPASS